MRELYPGRVPLKVWADHVEEGAMQQAVNLCNLPFAYSHVALMPDVHEGFGMPIGGVLAAENMVIPNAVGVDIGCGVLAAKTDIKDITSKQVEKILEKARKQIPMGTKYNKNPSRWEGFIYAPDSEIIKQEFNSARYQLGSLGGGNHFYSIERGSDGHIWLLIHSGSRNFGYKVANYYNKAAVKNNDKKNIVPRNYNLAPLELDSEEGKEYFEAMNFCLDFAKASRDVIFTRLYNAFCSVTGSKKVKEKIDIHHNYAAVEEHFGREVVVHRKGATRAREGELGVIPGSMGTPSYVVEGLGSPESFMSCAHGAGRTMSRRKANELITKEMADKSMQGIVFRGWKGDLSEAPQAYKDIDQVMRQQEDLVKPLVKLTPLGVIKE